MVKSLRFNAENGFITTPERSRIMSKIKGRDTKPELKLRKALWNSGLHFRINNKSLPGCPDISIKKYKLAIFVDGEFWHGYNWEEKKCKIKANRDYWIPKIEKNIARDIESNTRLADSGYTVFRFWAGNINKNLGKCVKEILDYIFNEFDKHSPF